MAVTPTPRLGLNKQAPGDATWGGPLNSGFDNADARFMTTSAGTPVAVQQGFFVGQLHFQTSTSPPTIWVCTAIGSPGTWVLAGQVGLGFDGIVGPLILNNTVALQGKDTVAVATNIAQVNAANDVEVGAPTRNIVLRILTAATGLGIRVGAGAIQKIWHEANDGVGSGLDADLVNGISFANMMALAGPNFFDSGELAVSGVVSAAHGLVTVPRVVTAKLRCKVAEFGYSIGDEISVMTDISQDYGGNRISVWSNATNVGVSSTAGYLIIDRVTPAFGGNIITNANWRFVLRAWK